MVVDRRLFLSFVLGLTFGCGPNIIGELDQVRTDGVSIFHLRLFTTSTVHLPPTTGIAGWDAICSARASAAGLTREYLAVVSNATTSAASRFSLDAPISVVLGDSSIQIASGLSHFWNASSAPLYVAPHYDEYGTIIVSGLGAVATGSTAAGLSNTEHCQSWSTNAGTQWVRSGSMDLLDGQFLSLISTQCSLTVHRVYCLSQ